MLGWFFNTRHLMHTRRTLIFTAVTAVAPATFAKAAISSTGGDTQIPLLGLSLPQTGVQSEIAQDLLDGYQLASLAAGETFGVLALDDESKAENTAKNIEALSNNHRVLAVSGIVGTPHAQAALPIAVRAGLPVVGIRSGAASLRKGQSGVFHLRSTYESELIRMSAMLAGAGYKRVQIIFSDDSFGKESKQTLSVSLAALGVSAPDPIPVDRNGGNMKTAVAEVAKRCMVFDRTPTAIVLLVISAPAVKATQMLRTEHKIIFPVYAMSHVLNRTVASKVIPGFTGFGAMLAFPLPRTNTEIVAGKFRETATKAGKKDLIESPTAYEGFFYGSVFAKALRSAGSATRKGVVASLQSGIDVYGMPIHPNALGEGYGFIDVARKDSVTGLLRI